MENRPLSRQLGDNVRRLRKGKGLSLAEVSSRMGALGMPLSLNGLSKVELGNRDLGVDELVALAEALNLPPLVVLFPLGTKREVELFPGTNVDTWAAAKWFTGEAPFPGTADAVRVESDPPTTYFRTQDELIGNWRRARERVDEARRTTLVVGQGPDDQSVQALDFLEEVLRSRENHLRDYRRIVRKVGLDLGELPPDLAHVDEG